jgi:hypothetical protein
LESRVDDSALAMTPKLSESHPPPVTSIVTLEDQILANQEVQQLFARFPGLKEYLNTTYHATLPPDQKPQIDGERKERKERQGREFTRNRKSCSWTREQGFKQGLKKLRTAMEPSSPLAEGLQAFSALVAKLGAQGSSENN